MTILEIFTLIAICLTLVPGVNFFIKHRLHKKLMIEKMVLDNEVNKWPYNSPEQNIAVKKRKNVLDKIFKYQYEMSQSNYFLAAGACSFAVIEAYKLILHFIEISCNC